MCEFLCVRVFVRGCVSMRVGECVYFCMGVCQSFHRCVLCVYVCLSVWMYLFVCVYFSVHASVVVCLFVRVCVTKAKDFRGICCCGDNF